MLLLRANTLARGHSGVRVELVERLLELLALINGTQAITALVALAAVGEDHPLADDLEAGDKSLAEAVNPHLEDLL